MRYIMFTKHLQTLSISDMGRVVKDLGFSGVELTVRKGGHVLPENVASDLPRAVEQLAEIGLTVPAIVVEIHRPSDPYAEEVCKVAGQVGATHLRTSSQRYSVFGSLRDEVAAMKRDVADLARLATDTGVRICIHTHSGNFLSAQGAILASIVDGTDPRAIGVSFDLGHLTVEGGLSGWRQNIELLHDRVGIVAVKSFGWKVEIDPATGLKKWHPLIVPLRDGNVQWAQGFKLMRQLGWDQDDQSLVSIHSEYQGSETWRDLTVPELIDQTRDDFQWLREQATV